MSFCLNLILVCFKEAADDEGIDVDESASSYSAAGVEHPATSPASHAQVTPPTSFKTTISCMVFLAV